MQTWIYFVLIAQSVWAFCSLIDKFVISKGHIKSPFVYIVLNGAMNILLVFLLPFFDFGKLNIMDFFIVLLSNASLAAAVILYYQAVKYEEISRIIILYQFIPIFTLLLSFFILGESLSANDIIGFALLILAGIIVSYHKEKKSFRIGKAFYLMMLSGFLTGIAYITAKHVFRVTDFWSGVLWLRLGAFLDLAVLLVPSVRGEFIRTFQFMSNKVRGLLGFKMIIDFSAFVISDFAILLGPVSLVSALSASSAPALVFVFVALASLYLPHMVKEELNRKNVFIKTSAIVFIMLGIFFINIQF